jgi:predicted Zn-dependent protease
MRVFELAVDADFEFYSTHGGGTLAEIESTLNIVDGIFQTDLNLTLQLVSSHIWDAEPDPYTSTSSGTLLQEFRNHWNANFAGVTRDAAHLFTGKDLDGATVGIAYVGVVCSTNVAYSLSQDLASDALMPLLVAHEVGHNLGANHDPDSSPVRYIMYPSLSLSNLDEFSDLSKTEIGTYTGGVTCLALADPNDPGDPPPGGGGGTGGGGGGGGGGGPVDPLLLVLLAGGALCSRRAARGRPAPENGP